MLPHSNRVRIRTKKVMRTMKRISSQKFLAHLYNLYMILDGASKPSVLLYTKGAESIGYPGVIHGLFPNRGADLVQYFYLTCNNELNKVLKEQARVTEDNPTKEKKTLETQLQDAVKIRLKMVIPYKKTWPQALALMTLPPNVPKSLANLLTLVDDICYYSGDRSVDINWYTRRIVLAGIYKTTELYMLQDNSEDNKQTWNFLERRIKEAMQIQSILTTTSDMALPEQALNRATEAASAAFITARNILGLNWNR
ncbi:ubiquinone biosynthesis protein COQ9, mitochondrial isoform X3 [Nomia melanderi]|uniref:ubiquinone biosynthesis protein COQ9, mitochondrial isoform X3 n=1 Tax=Nomia melanderi TaxID=2448451 RepID=UPI00130400EB|nr:ubiquinone biosynthesis protein COQ9, mitochondrial isoform X3 [Nomia melanderi]